MKKMKVPLSPILLLQEKKEVRTIKRSKLYCRKVDSAGSALEGIFNSIFQLFL